MNKTAALILAGGNLPDDLKQYSAGHDNRALLKIADRYMIEYVVDALNGVEGIGEILVVGLKDPLDKVLAGRVTEVVAPKDSMLDNLNTGLDRFASSDRLLIVTCDIPLITPQIVSRYLEQCTDPAVDFYYPVISKEMNDRKYPGTKRTYFRMSEGVFTGGNIMMVSPAAIKRNWKHIDKAISARKSPMKLLGILGIGGIGTIIRFVMGMIGMPMLTFGMAMKTLKNIFGIVALQVHVADPEIGIDVDKEVDYLLVKDILENRNNQ